MHTSTMQEEGAGDKRRVLCVTAATEVHQLGDQGEHNIGLTKQEERQHTSRSASKDKETGTVHNTCLCHFNMHMCKIVRTLPPILF